MYYFYNLIFSKSNLMSLVLHIEITLIIILWVLLKIKINKNDYLFVILLETNMMLNFYKIN